MSTKKSQIDLFRLPKHIGIIMDGNGRWAVNTFYPRIYGHRNAVKAVRSTVEAAVELKISVMTLYAFSTENWQRPEDEVSELMNLFKEYLDKELKNMLDNNIKFVLSGDQNGLPEFLKKSLNYALDLTSSNSGLTLNLAVNYGGRAELVRAFKKIYANLKKGLLKEDQINEDLISKYTYTSGIPDPDMIIRTSGEKRMSNFLLWQSAYSEYIYSDVLWPEFNKEHFYDAIYQFQLRERKMGKTKNI